MRKWKVLVLVILSVLVIEGCSVGEGKDSVEQKISEEAIIQ